jgi:putative phosphoesterase
MRIGLIADTHGLVRSDVAAAFAGVALILHAGDVGSSAVLTELECIAPVDAVQGNADPGDLRLPRALSRKVDGVEIFVTHGNEVVSPTPDKLVSTYHADVIVFGHTHRPIVRRLGATLVVNPGAAGPRRFNLLPSVAILTIENGVVDVQIVNLAA